MVATALIGTPLIDTAIADIQVHLHELQWQADLATGKFVIVGQDPHGFGGQISRRQLGLQIGYMLNRTVIFERPDDPPYALCYQPFGKYTPEDVAHLPIAPLRFGQHQAEQVTHFDFSSFWQDTQIRARSSIWVPPQLAPFPCGRLLFEGLLLAPFRLLEDYAQHVEAAKARIGFEQPIIGLHVRRGDKEVETPYVPLPVLMEQVMELRDKTGISRVYVTSDSDKTFAELPRDAGLDYVYDHEEKRYDNANHLFLLRHPELQKQETLTAVKILELLSDCNYVVGQDNAHLPKLAAARIAARTHECTRHRFVPGNYAVTFAGAPLRNWPKLLLYEKPRRSRAVAWLLQASAPVRHRFGIRRRRWTYD